MIDAAALAIEIIVAVGAGDDAGGNAANVAVGQHHRLAVWIGKVFDAVGVLEVPDDGDLTAAIAEGQD